jgi:hypothetical protein
MLRRLGAVVGALALLTGSTFAVAPAASAASTHEGTDPVTTGCVSGAYVVSSWNVINTKYNQVQGRVELVYSPKCSTNWINLYGYTAGNDYAASIWHGIPPVGGGKRVSVAGVGSQHSLQIYAPGSSCVGIGWDLFDHATGLPEGSNATGLC